MTLIKVLLQGNLPPDRKAGARLSPSYLTLRVQRAVHLTLIRIDLSPIVYLLKNHTNHLESLINCQ